MRVLITGGAGFIGRRLAESLVEDGAAVAIVDLPERVASEQDLPAEAMQGSVDDAAFIQEAFDTFQPTLVYHLAALHYIPDCDRNPELTLRTNVEGTRVVADAAHRAGAKMVFSSTAAVYAPADELHHEDGGLGPIDIYGESKLAAEGILTEYAAKGLNVVIARLFNVYGPGDRTPHLIPRLVDQINGGTREVVCGNLDPSRDYVHVGDVAAGLRVLGEQIEGGIYNIGTGHQTSVRDVIQLCGEVIGQPIGIVQDPALIRAVDRMSLGADASALRATGWAPKVSFRDGLEELLSPALVAAQR